MEHIRIDHALIIITALVERWRPETNTFHFPSGEATVTFSNSLVSEVCLELLGKAPIQGADVNGINIKFTWLEANFAAVPTKKKNKKKKKLSKADEIYNTRAYIFFLVSSQIMSNTSGGRGPAYLLEFREFKPYAWVPSCLANLYWILAQAVNCVKDKVEDGHQEGDECKSSNKGDDSRKFRILNGPFQLLQLWVYTRMQIGRCPPPNDT